MDAFVPGDSAKKVFGEIVSEIESCFGKDVSRQVDEPTSIIFEYLPNDSLLINIGTGRTSGVVLSVDVLIP
jgi:Ethanolamine utilization protein EutJ (predicted chaperonin)